MDKNTESVFLAALEKGTPDGRVAYAEGACADDRELFERVKRLLAAHENSRGPLDSPPTEAGEVVDQPSTEAHIITEKPGVEIGPYKLLQEIGHGGMGLVFMAQQTKPVSRRVALKIIKPGMDSRQVIARFEAERQALALMDHPNIAKVLDAGTTDSGRPYFVMELVKGVSLTSYCDDQHLSPRERLELFIPICQAVQHAHQKGIIHRDLKPGNVLVALFDGKPVPKVIDFGVAKAVTQKLTDKTLFTQFNQVIGTLEYMSPEQAQLNQLDIDTRSDIYSLGVLLYELLTGSTPLDSRRLRAAGYEEIMRLIREEEPMRPSVRLSSIETLPSVAANRHSEPKKLQMLVRGELDWIVMKALEKDRARRYETANGFAADIQRYLDDEPVVACPPSAVYKLKKFARRNKAVLSAASVLAIAILLGLVGTVWQAQRANQERTKSISAELEKKEAIWDKNKTVLELELANAKVKQVAGQAKVAEVMRVTVVSKSIKAELPMESALLAIEAVRLAKETAPATINLSHDHLVETASDLGGTPIVPFTGFKATNFVANDRSILVHHNKNILVLDLNAKDPAVSPIVLPHDVETKFAKAFSPDGKRVVTTEAGGAARVWDMTTSPPKLLRVLTPPKQSIPAAVAIGGLNNRWVISGYRDFTPFNIPRLSDMEAEDPSASSIELVSEEFKHKDQVQQVAISPDGRWAVTASLDSRVALWDLAAKDPSALPIVLRDHDPQVTDSLRAIEMSRDSHWLATAGLKTVRLWDLKAKDPSKSGRLLRNEGTASLAISRDSHWLYAGSFKSEAAYRWDLTATDPTKLPTVFRGHKRPISAVAISPDNRRFITNSYDGTGRIWDLESITINDLPAMVDTDSQPANVWDVLGTNAVGSTRALSGIGTFSDGQTLAITADSNRLVTTGASGLRMWNLDSENPGSSMVLRSHSQSVGPVAVSPDGRWLATGSDDKTVRLWDLRANDPSARSTVLEGHTEELRQIAISPDSRWLVTCTGLWRERFAGKETTVRVWDLKAPDPRKRVRVLEGHDGPITSISISPDSTMLVTGSVDATARIWSLVGDASPSRVLQGRTGRIKSVAFGSDSHSVITGGAGDDGIACNVHIWKLNAEDPLTSTELSGENNREMITAIAVSPNGEWMVTGSSFKPARLWNMKDPANPISQDIPNSSNFLTVVAFSPDGRWLATSSWSGNASVWDLSAKSPLPFPYLAPGGNVPVAFSQDSRWFVAGTRVTDLRADDPKSTTMELRGHTLGVNSVAITPDNRWVVTGGSDGTSRLWELNVDKLIARTRRIVGRELSDDEREQYSIPKRDVEANVP